VQYRGENLGETAARAVSRGEKRAVRSGWRVPGVSAPVAAIIEKEFRYLSRSGPMLFTLIMPLVILLIFRFSTANAARRGGFPAHFADFAFPVGAAYALLILSGVIYNRLGADGAGVQYFFLSPLRFREVMLAKNLADAAVLAVEMVFVWAGASLMFRPPPIGVTLATLAGTAFAALVNFSAGNLLSLYAPKRIDFSVFGRQRASGITAFASLGIQIVTFGLAALAVLAAVHLGRIWVATILLLALAAVASAGYTLVLRRIDRIALDQREAIFSELCRA
jgi:ABC-2 type transport system permease protein